MIKSTIGCTNAIRVTDKEVIVSDVKWCETCEFYELAICNIYTKAVIQRNKGKERCGAKHLKK
jgi:hypothetical protein